MAGRSTHARTRAGDDVPDHVPGDAVAPPSHDSLARVAADWITERILNGEIAPGAKLAETRLADRMRMSRSPVREALHALSREGLVLVEPRRGAFVAELDRDNASEIYACRLLLEPECVRLAVDAMEPQRRVVLRDSFARMRHAAEDQDPAAYLTALKEHNLDLLDGCPNRVLFGYTETAWRASMRYWNLTLRGSRDNVGRSLQRNRRIQRAVERGDGSRAASAAADALRTSRQELLRHLDRLPAAG